MNKKIKIINIISLIPILAFPIYLVVGIMAFSSPNVEKSQQIWFYILAAYPLFILSMFFLSRKLNSLILAILGLIPLLVFALVIIFLILGQIIMFNTLKRITNVDYKGKTFPIENIKDYNNKEVVDITNRYFVGETNSQKFHFIHTTMNGYRNSDQVSCVYVLDGLSDSIKQCDAEFGSDGWFVINLTGFQNRLVGYEGTFDKGKIYKESKRSEKPFNVQEVDGFKIEDFLKK